MIALPCLLRCRHGSAIRSKHTAATYFLGLALDDTPYWRNARFGTRRRAFAGRTRGLVSFRDRMADLVPGLWQDGRFGTRESALSFLRPGVSSAHGYQIGEVGLKRGTKPPHFASGRGEIAPRGSNRSIREMLSGRLSDDATMTALALMGCAGRRAGRRCRRRAAEGNRGETPLLYQEP